MAFMIGPSAIKNAGAFNKYIGGFVQKSDGWGWEDNMKTYGWTNKLGWVAKKAGAKVVLALDELHQPLRRISLISMKSYGEKWEGSEAKFTATVSLKQQNTTHHSAPVGSDPTTTTTMHVLGSHNSTTSVSYTDVMELSGHGAGVGDGLTLEIELVGGTTFKIQGLMICSY